VSIRGLISASLTLRFIAQLRFDTSSPWPDNEAMKPLRLLVATLLLPLTLAAAEPPCTYENELVRLQNPPPLLADHPEFVAPVKELVRYEAPILVDDASADLLVRAWRFSYNASGIIEVPNRHRAADTAIIFVHPWGIDDGQGWRTPEPAGVADFCTLEKNKLPARHTREVIAPFITLLRGKVRLVMHSLPGSEDPMRPKLYRFFTRTPSALNGPRAQRNSPRSTMPSIS
jgi:hypothetical protein